MSSGSAAGKAVGVIVAIAVAVGVMYVKSEARSQRAAQNDQKDAALSVDYRAKAMQLLALSKECMRDKAYTEWAVDQFHAQAFDDVSIKIGLSAAHVEGSSYRDALMKLMADQALKDNRPELSQAIEGLNRAAAGIGKEWYEIRPNTKVK